MRYDVTIKMDQEHHFAVEADSPGEAQTLAMEQMADRNAEQWHLDVVVEKGVR